MANRSNSTIAASTKTTSWTSTRAACTESKAVCYMSQIRTPKLIAMFLPDRESAIGFRALERIWVFKISRRQQPNRRQEPGPQAAHGNPQQRPPSLLDPARREQQLEPLSSRRLARWVRAHPILPSLRVGPVRRKLQRNPHWDQPVALCRLRL